MYSYLGGFTRLHFSLGGHCCSSEEDKIKSFEFVNHDRNIKSVIDFLIFFLEINNCHIFYALFAFRNLSLT